MISQNCPKCSSTRVRRGYRRTSIFMKLTFRYHLLCDSCNWEFKGFAVPGTVTTKPKGHGKKKRKNLNQQNKVQPIQSETNQKDVTIKEEVETKKEIDREKTSEEVKEKYVVADKPQTKKTEDDVEIQETNREAPPGKKIIKKRKKIREFEKKDNKDSGEDEEQDDTKKRIKRRKRVKIKFY